MTVRHNTDEIYDEFKIISKHGCTLETIDYHLPGIETPLSRRINTKDLEDGKRYTEHLNAHPEQKEALDNLYKSVNNVHSHVISGPDMRTLDELMKDLEKQGEVIGKNLSNKEISEITRKELEI